jgi:pantoate--beta-alanine ligase
MQRLSRRLAAEKKRIGLVPTMGFLHDGHISLIKRAKRLADVVITTIFINPTQFALNEDLGSYPRDEKGDIGKIRTAGGEVVFIPRAGDIYGKDFQTFVDVEKLTKKLEGRFRPTHFRGVTTIVAKLLNITRPDIAVFGQKDYQQAVVIKQMVRDLDYPVKIVVAPIVREKDGLAMSSRNKYFNPEQRKEAICLYRALAKARELARNETRLKAVDLRAMMKRTILKECPSAAIDYIGFTDYDTLEDVKEIDRHTICSLAVTVYGVRLIDNMRLL